MSAYRGRCLECGEVTGRGTWEIEDYPADWVAVSIVITIGDHVYRRQGTACPDCVQRVASWAREERP